MSRILGAILVAAALAVFTLPSVSMAFEPMGGYGGFFSSQQTPPSGSQVAQAAPQAFTQTSSVPLAALWGTPVSGTPAASDTAQSIWSSMPMLQLLGF